MKKIKIFASILLTLALIVVFTENIRRTQNFLIADGNDSHFCEECNPVCGDGSGRIKIDTTKTTTNGEQCSVEIAQNHPECWNVKCDPYCDASHNREECVECTSECTCIPNTCGDGFLGSEEECEKNATSDVKCLWDYDADSFDSGAEKYTCNQHTCKCEPIVENKCGNGKVDDGEECDGNDVSACPVDGSTCSSTCTCVAPQPKPEPKKPVCGNGVVETGEMCDGDDSSCGEGFACKDCTCVEKLPDAGINHSVVLIWGIAMLLIGLFFEIIVSGVNKSYITINGNVVKLRQRKFESSVIDEDHSSPRRK